MRRFEDRLRVVLDDMGEGVGPKKQSPVVGGVRWSPASIKIQFPNGDLWEYIVYEDRWLKRLLKSYGRNVGRLASELNKLNCDKRKLK